VAGELWLKASTDGRLDPALAATALVVAVTSQAVKVNRVAESLTASTPPTRRFGAPASEHVP